MTGVCVFLPDEKEVLEVSLLPHVGSPVRGDM